MVRVVVLVLACTCCCDVITYKLQKWPETHFFTLFISTCASRHNGVHFFDISTSKSGLTLLRCFVHVYFQMCFAPQRRALFRLRNFQKCSETDVFCHFLFLNVLRATTARTFSILQLPKLLRDRRVLPLFISKCASRHNGAHFFDSSTSKSRPNLLCFDSFHFQMSFALQWRAVLYLSSC